MSSETICTIILGISSFFSLIYGLVNIRERIKGYFYPFIVIGFFGNVLSYIYIILLQLTDRNGMVFNLGSMGQLSAFLCNSFACRMIEKVDSCEVEKNNKAKYIGLLVPVVFIACWAVLFFNHVGFEIMIVPTLLLFLAAPCGYFCLKTIFTKYPKESLSFHLKPFFGSVLAFCVSTMFMELTWLYTESVANHILGYFLFIVKFFSFIFMAVFLERGTKKWLQT